jgi:hypothetical protein
MEEGARTEGERRHIDDEAHMYKKLKEREAYREGGFTDKISLVLVVVVVVEVKCGSDDDDDDDDDDDKPIQS